VTARLAICVGCAGIYFTEEIDNSICPECGLAQPDFVRKNLLPYAAHVLRYGYQYRNFYEDVDRSAGYIKPSLAPLPDILAWIALAAIGGVIGNATYDAIKEFIKGLQYKVSLRSEEIDGADKFVEMDDESIRRLVDYSADFMADLKGIQTEIRNDIVEEILADAVSEDLETGREILKLLMQKKPLRPIEKKRVADLHGKALRKKLRGHRVRPEELATLWPEKLKRK